MQQKYIFTSGLICLCCSILFLLLIVNSSFSTSQKCLGAYLLAVQLNMWGRVICCILFFPDIAKVPLSYLYAATTWNTWLTRQNECLNTITGNLLLLSDPSVHFNAITESPYASKDSTRCSPAEKMLTKFLQIYCCSHPVLSVMAASEIRICVEQ